MFSHADHGYCKPASKVEYMAYPAALTKSPHKTITAYYNVNKRITLTERRPLPGQKWP